MTGLRKKKFPAAQIQALFTQNPLFTFGLSIAKYGKGDQYIIPTLTSS